MDKFTLQRMTLPVVTGTPRVDTGRSSSAGGKKGQGPSFLEVLEQQFSTAQELTFSKHAAARVQQRGIDLSEGNIARLHEGVKLAQDKGLRDTLILVDSTAFIVNAQNGTVITTVDSKNLTGNVFTNIDGTVVI